MGAIGKIVISAVVIVVVAVGAWLTIPLFYDKQVNEDLPSDALLEEAVTVTANTNANTATNGDGGTGDNASANSNANGSVTTTAPTAVAREGTFQGTDSFHRGSGTARIVELNGKQYVRFEEDFTVTNGPDLYVYFGNNGTYDKDTNLGRLKGSSGSQNYEIPSDINIDEYGEVWVWCRAFSVPFASATL